MANLNETHEHNSEIANRMIENGLTFQLLYKKFMEESKTETFNENEFKIYQALKTLGKEGLTDFEKAKIINDIINPKN